MLQRLFFPVALLLVCQLAAFGQDSRPESPTLQPVSVSDSLPAGNIPTSWRELWDAYDPQAEPLETEVVRQWQEDGVTLRIVRFRIGVFKGQKATLAAIYGVPTASLKNKTKIPGLLQIHGGGQFADHRACVLNAKRGYATLSIAWAGRISAPEYRVAAAQVKLFWDDQTDNKLYRLTTDWGAVDGYHAPSRNDGNHFPSVQPAAWTIDSSASPRNSPWFLCTIAARRALTFLEEQGEVDPDRLGVYGHSMGGKLTVLTASTDRRVKAAAPSCGGISDRDNASELFRNTLGDDASLQRIRCPIAFLSPANDFHGRIGDLPRAVREIQSPTWRVTCSPQGNHQDAPEYEVASLLWFDEQLKNEFTFPATPLTKLEIETKGGTPTIAVIPDPSRQRDLMSVDVYYTQDGKDVETSSDREDTVHRFWRHAKPNLSAGNWKANLPDLRTDRPLWVYANAKYRLNESVAGAGYYYRPYSVSSFYVSSLVEKVPAKELVAANVEATHLPELLIEDFGDDWQKEWFSYKSDQWPRSTHKIGNGQFRPPPGEAKLAFRVRMDQTNSLVVMIDSHAAVVNVDQNGQWQEVALSLSDFHDHAGNPLSDWKNTRQLTLSDVVRLKPPGRTKERTKIVGRNWMGSAPEFQDLRWTVTPRTYDIFLLAGQSNMDGRGRTANLPDSTKRPFTNTIIFYQNPVCASFGWQPLEPGYSVAPRYRGTLPSPTFGPEIGFATAMTASEPNKYLALIKCAKGGTSLRKDWHPGSKDQPETQGPRYRDLLQTIALAKRGLRNAGHDGRVRGLLWHQGESDSKSSAQDHEDRLRRFINRLREDVDVRQLPIVIGDLFDNGKRDSVRHALRTVGESGSKMAFVSSTKLSTWDEGTHFDANSQLLLGQRYGDAMRRLLRESASEHVQANPDSVE